MNPRLAVSDPSQTGLARSLPIRISGAWLQAGFDAGARVQEVAQGVSDEIER